MPPPPPDASPLPPALEARYTVVATLGEGASGVVVRARDPELRRDVVIKVVDLACIDDGETMAARVLQEARLLAGIRHPNLVGLLDSGREGPQVYLIYPFREARDLEGILRERAPLPAGEVRRILRELLAGLGELHARGVVHRDLKPPNVLRLEDGTHQLIDLGLAKDTVGGEDLTRTAAFLGTPLYASPEQIMGEPPDPRDDLYSLGVLAYRALTGIEPFRAKDLHEVLRLQLSHDPPPVAEVREEVPRELSLLVAALMQKDREDRPEDCAAAAALLEPAPIPGAAEGDSGPSAIRPAGTRPHDADPGPSGTRPLDAASIHPGTRALDPTPDHAGTRPLEPAPGHAGTHALPEPGSPGPPPRSAGSGPPSPPRSRGLALALLLGGGVALAGLFASAALGPRRAPPSPVNRPFPAPPPPPRAELLDPGFRDALARRGRELPARGSPELAAASRHFRRAHAALREVEEDARAGRVPPGELATLVRLDGLLGGKTDLDRIRRRAIETEEGRRALTRWLAPITDATRSMLAAGRRALRAGAGDAAALALAETCDLLAAGIPADPRESEVPPGSPSGPRLLEGAVLAVRADAAALAGEDPAPLLVRARASFREVMDHPESSPPLRGDALVRLLRNHARQPGRRTHLLRGRHRTADPEALRAAYRRRRDLFATIPPFPAARASAEVLRIDEKYPTELALEAEERTHLRKVLAASRARLTEAQANRLTEEFGNQRFFR